MASAGEEPTKTDDMTCQVAVELLNDYLEGALDPGDRARLEAHLAECPYCVTYLDQLRLTTRLCARVRATEVPGPVMDVLLQAYRER